MMKGLILKFGSLVAALALMVTTVNVNSTCMLMAHQPKLPAGAEKLRRM